MNAARKATIALASTTVIWASTFLAGKIAFEALGAQTGGSAYFPIWVNLARMLVAIPVFLLFCPRAVRLKGRDIRDSFFLALPGATGIVLSGWGLLHASIAVSAFLVNLTVVFTPILGFLFFRERLPKPILVGLAITFAGVWVLTNPGGGRFGWSEAALVCGALSFALQIHLINRFTKDRDSEAMTLGLMAHLAWMSFLPLLARPDLLSLRFFAPLDHGPFLHRWGVILGVGFLAVFGTVLAFWVFMRYQRELPATRAAIIYSLEPVIAAMLAWPILGEALGVSKIIGGVLILAGNLICELLRPEPPAQIGQVPVDRPVVAEDKPG